jgi:hypothetical protein
MADTVLFLDVDGTLLPFGPGAGPVGDGRSVNPLLARLNPAHGPSLAALGCTLVWATGWMDEANDEISPRLGLPPLPVVDWPDDEDELDDGLHWKTRLLVAWAEGRPFVWIDDEISDADRVWVAETYPAPALLHRVESHIGLTDDDIRTVQRWLTNRS